MMMMAQQSDGGAGAGRTTNNNNNEGETVIAGPSRPSCPPRRSAHLPLPDLTSPEEAPPPSELHQNDQQHDDEENISEEEEEEERGTAAAGGSRRLGLDEILNYSINPNSSSRATPSPISPAGSLKSNNGGGGGGANSATRRIFTPAFKQSVLDAYLNDPECIGNQRATARKFGIHRRQVQKWLQQLGGFTFSDDKEQNSSDDQQEVHHSNSSTPGSASHNSSRQQESSSPPRTPITPPETKPRRKKQMQSIPSESLRHSSSSVAGRSSQIQTALNPSSNIPGTSANNFLASFQNMSKTIGSIPPSIYAGHSSNSLLGTNPMLQASIQSHSSTSRPSSRSRHSPVGNVRHSNGSPPNGNSSAALSDVVDELCRVFPREDFTTLRRAIWRREVTLTKLAPISSKNNRSDLERENMPSTSRGQTDESFQQAVELIRSHNYLSLIQSGLINTLDTANLNETSIPWLQSITAAMSGFNSPPSNIPHGSNGISENRRRPNDQHNFLSPRAPVSTAKARTVAVELAEQRGVGLNGINGNGSHSSIEKPKRQAQSRRKPATTNGRSGRPPSSGARLEEPNDLEIDPRSMVEVVTTQPMSSPSQNSTENGIDLSSTASSVIYRNATPITTTSTLRSKAMNKDYGFLSELGLSRRESPPNRTNGNNGMSSTASLENFVQNILPLNGGSNLSNGGGGSGDSSSNSPPLNDSVAESFEQKNMVLEAFHCDPEVMGDARGVARKFQLNMRVVQKWIREATNRPIPSHESHLTNGSGPSTSEYLRQNTSNEMGDDSLEAELAIAVATRNINGGSSVNRRKNSKPNQICDFTEDDETEVNDPVDMVVPIKKRRVSTPTPTSN